MGRPGYPAEFRRKVLDLLAEGRSVASVAHDLDVSDQTIYNWRRQDLVDRGLQDGLTTAETGELAAAKKRIAELETELAIAQRAVDLLKEETGHCCIERSLECLAANLAAQLHSTSPKASRCSDSRAQLRRSQLVVRRPAGKFAVSASRMAQCNRHVRRGLCPRRRSRHLAPATRPATARRVGLEAI